MRKNPFALMSVLFVTLFVSVVLMAASVYLLGTSEGLMLSLMQRYAPPEKTNLPESEYPAVVRMMTDYLAGRTHAFQHTYMLNGTEVSAFNAREQQHMEDVQKLFGLAQSGALMAGVMVVFLSVRALFDHKFHRAIEAETRLSPRIYYRALRTGLLIVLGLVALIALWAAVDFNSLFILFHKIAFTNDLWLLNPRTDLLIRLMPTEFFVAYAAMIGAAWATGMGLAILLTFLLAKERNK